MPHIKCYDDHKGYLMTDHCVQSDFRFPVGRVVGFMVEYLRVRRVKSFQVNCKVVSSRDVLGEGILDRSMTLP